MARQKHKPMEPEILPGLTVSGLQELLSSVNQQAEDGDPNLLTAREFAKVLDCSLEMARKHIQILMSIGKAEVGPKKPMRKMDGSIQAVSAYRFLVV